MAERHQEELYIFLEEYADFLARMVKDEEEKLAALLSNSLPRIEGAISTAQANAKQMENYETTRIRLQDQAGYGGMSFSEIIENAPEEEQQSLEALLTCIQGYVDDIKFHNTKAMRVARANILEINPGAEIPGAPQASASGAYLKARDKTTGTKTMLETKI